MAEEISFPVTPNWDKSAWVNHKDYLEKYANSLKDNDQFWDEVAGRLHWTQRWSKTKEVNFNQPVHIEWFRGGKLNVSYNCIDRHLPEHASRVAFYWEPEGTAHKAQTITYQKLKDEVCRLANGMKSLGVRKG